MRKIILVVESGADIPKEYIGDDRIFVVPMHVSMYRNTLDNGSFPVEEIFTYYKVTGQLPQSSAPSPYEYQSAFWKIHQQYPDCQILHLCYSSATTSSFQNALIGSEGMDFVTHIDSKCVTAEQALLTLRTADFIDQHPEADMAAVVSQVEVWIRQSRIAFIPENLAFLKAGGRVSNAAYLGASILSLKPVIEITDGKLLCAWKYRGSMKHVIRTLIQEKFSGRPWEDGQVCFVYTDGLHEELKAYAEQAAKEAGTPCTRWIKAGAAVSVHGGPGVFGICGMVKPELDTVK